MAQSATRLIMSNRVQYVLGILFIVAGFLSVFASRWIDAGWGFTMGAGYFLVLYLQKHPELNSRILTRAVTVSWIVLLGTFTIVRFQMPR
jgi:hypothetical protein